MPPIQNKIVDLVTKKVSEAWQSEIEIGSIYLTPTLNVVVNDFAIKDTHHNDMIVVKYLKSRLKYFTIKPVTLSFTTLYAEGADVIVRKYVDDERVNIAIWADKFKKEKPTKKAFILHANRLRLKDSRFCYQNDEKRRPADGNIDYAYFELANLNFQCTDFTVNRDDISGKISQLAFDQYSGFKLDNGCGHFRINSKNLVFNDLVLVTPNSRLFLDFAFEYDSWQTYGDFVNSVLFNVKVRPSLLNLKDVAYFAPAMKGMDNRIKFLADVHGPVNALAVTKSCFYYGNHTFFAGDFTLKNLTDIKNVDLALDFRNSNFDLSEIATVKLPQGKTLALPPILTSVKNADLRGTFNGTLTNFETHLQLTSSLGNVDADFSVKEEANKLIFSGLVKPKQVNLRQILSGSEFLQSATLALNIKGSAASPKVNDNFIKTAKFDVNGTISQLKLQNYVVENVQVSGKYAHQLYEATVVSQDSNLHFAFDGEADLRAATPKFWGKADIDEVAFGALFLPKSGVLTPRKTENAWLRYVAQHPDMSLKIRKLQFNAKGSTLEELSGVVMVDSLQYCQDSNALNLKMVRLLSSYIDGVHKYKLTSDIANASLSTSYQLDDMLDTVAELGYRYFSNLLPAKENTTDKRVQLADNQQDRGFFTFELSTFQTRRFLAMFFPTFSVSPNTMLYFHTDGTGQNDTLNLVSARLRLNDKVQVNNISLHGSPNKAKQLGITCSADSVSILRPKQNLTFSNILLKTQTEENNLQYHLSWKNAFESNATTSFLAGYVNAFRRDSMLIRFTESALHLQNDSWHFADDNAIWIKSGAVEFDQVRLSAARSSLFVDGTLSKSPQDALTIGARNFDLEILNAYLRSGDIHLDGDLSATLNLTAQNARRTLYGKAFISEFNFNHDHFGNVYLLAKLPPAGNIDFYGGIFDRQETMTSEEIAAYSYQQFEQEPLKVALLKGGYHFDNQTFRVNANIATLPLNFLSPFLSSFSHVVNGEGSGNLTFIAQPDTFYFDGKVLLKDANLGIAPLNTIYRIQNQYLDFNRQGIDFHNVTLTDAANNSATLNGHFRHHKFKDFRLDLDISTEKIMVLNTTKASEMPFYGEGYVSGKVSITGDSKKLLFSGNNLRTERGTKFFLPLNFSTSASESEVIIFKPAPTAQKEKVVAVQKLPMDLDFDFNFHITPEALVQLELDPSIGGTMQAKVEGPLRLIYNNVEDLALTGTLSLQSGSFHLTLKDIIDKMLTLKPGGTINFMGPIDAATIGISAVYKTTASLNEIIPPEISGGGLRRTPVNAYLNLGGKLMNPNVNFSFELPNSSNELSTLFFSTIDTTISENLTRQFFSLLVLGKFETNEQLNTNMVTSAVEYSGIELLTNTINNFISRNLKYVDIGVNYRNADDTHAEEYSLSASTSLYNDRILIEGSFGYTNDKNNIYGENNSNNFIGDYSIEYALNEAKNWRVKVFNITNQYSSLTQTSPYAQGVALIYKQEFNNGKDIRDSFKRKKKEKKSKEEKPSKKGKKREKK